jgi:hypothetical protein
VEIPQVLAMTYIHRTGLSGIWYELVLLAIPLWFESRIDRLETLFTLWPLTTSPCVTRHCTYTSNRVHYYTIFFKMMSFGLCTRVYMDTPRTSQKVTKYHRGEWMRTNIKRPRNGK